MCRIADQTLIDRIYDEIEYPGTGRSAQEFWQFHDICLTFSTLNCQRLHKPHCEFPHSSATRERKRNQTKLVNQALAWKAVHPCQPVRRSLRRGEPDRRKTLFLPYRVAKILDLRRNRTRPIASVPMADPRGPPRRRCSFAAATTFLAASVRPLAVMILRPLLSSKSLPISELVPSRRTTRGPGNRSRRRRPGSQRR